MVPCLESLTAQTGGVRFEIIVVDDASTDRTREIAESFLDVHVIHASPLPEDGEGKRCTGKNNAVIAGAKRARADWLLFTDADTVHLPRSLARALEEAKKENADLLSYSPEQIVVTLTERAVMPVIFAELARQYPPHKVRDRKSEIVAANGQYILVRRAAYRAVGGHAAVAQEILEDVALAKLFRDAGFRVYFRYGGDAVRTRMYRNWTQLRDGWTKNLALLFPLTQRLAMVSASRWFVAWFAIYIAASAVIRHRYACVAAATTIAATLWLFIYRRIRIARFSAANNLIAMALGPPIFAYLLLRSTKAHQQGRVVWKGRRYDVGLRSQRTSASNSARIVDTKNRELRAEN